MVEVKFLCAAVDIRDSALPSAAKIYKSLRSLCVCNQWAYADNCADAVDRLLIGDILLE